MKEEAIQGQDNAQLIRLPGQSRARASLRDLEERRRLTFAALNDHAIAALASVREVASGVYPPSLARFGVVEALRARAHRASAEVRVSGDVPRTTEEAEAAVYFSCSEATQNVVKHAGRAARAELSSPGLGTALTISLPWPTRPSRTEPRGLNPDRRAARRHWMLRR
jgi:hypothetical protein